jgi:uncharacterized phage protein (TIGR02220 family)
LSVIRVKKDTNYVVRNKTALNDDRLTWTAKGIMSYLLSMPNDWVFYTEDLIKHAVDGEASFRTGFKELEQLGYVKQHPVREGKKLYWEMIVFENPLLSGSQQVEKSDVENRELLSTDSLPNNDLDDKENIPFTEIIEYLNEKTGSRFKTTGRKTRGFIKARWNEGFTFDDFQTVIDKKTAEWLKDEKMNPYLRPETLFGTKFESYLNQKGGRYIGKNGTSTFGGVELPF